MIRRRVPHCFRWPGSPTPTMSADPSSPPAPPPPRRASPSPERSRSFSSCAPTTLYRRGRPGSFILPVRRRRCVTLARVARITVAVPRPHARQTSPNHVEWVSFYFFFFCPSQFSSDETGFRRGGFVYYSGPVREGRCRPFFRRVRRSARASDGVCGFADRRRRRRVDYSYPTMSVERGEPDRVHVFYTHRPIIFFFIITRSDDNASRWLPQPFGCFARRFRDAYIVHVGLERSNHIDICHCHPVASVLRRWTIRTNNSFIGIRVRIWSTRACVCDPILRCGIQTSVNQNYWSHLIRYVSWSIMSTYNSIVYYIFCLFDPYSIVT